jgi:hypothetical protein
LETGQRTVEPLALEKLAALYGRSVGYFTGAEVPDASFGSEVKHLARKIAAISPADREELRWFAEFLRVRREKTGGTNRGASR